MTYDARETGMQSGEPIELYQFIFGENIYRYTSSKEQVTYSGEVWLPAPLKRSSIDFTSEKGRNNIKIETSRTFPVADLFRLIPPSDVVMVTIYRKHRGDIETVIIWSGRMLNVEFAGSSATLQCEPVSTSLRRTGLRRLYQRQCPHVLYGSACRANKSAFTVPVTLSAANGNTLNSPTFGLYASGYFAGGYIDFNSNGVVDRRFITEHTGSQIKINLIMPELAVGSVITAYAGCDHTTPTCQGKFNNLNNYGGMPDIPRKNPFGTNGIY